MKPPFRYDRLPAYTFDRLRDLLGSSPPGGAVVDMSVGEPRHEFPQFVREEIFSSADLFGRYPPKDGEPVLLDAIAAWLKHRYGVTVEPRKNILVASGSREALFNACVALCPQTKHDRPARVLIPNPFYQVYAGAAVAANAVPQYVNATRETGFLPDFASIPEPVLDDTAIVYVCSPSNPQGAVASLTYLKNLMQLAQRHDFLVFADECYSEIYSDVPPPGILETSKASDIDVDRMLSFNSLSKRSNVPGMRMGFVAGGSRPISHLKKYRSYSDPGVPVPLQIAAAGLWADEKHVRVSRQKYQSKYRLCDDMLGHLSGYSRPLAGFFLWLDVGDGEAAALDLWQNKGIKVVPGTYFGSNANGTNPGSAYVRAALVAEEDELAVGLECLRELML